MLTTDLVRVSFRSGKIYPRRVKSSDPKVRALAERLIRVWLGSVGKSRAEWDESLKDMIGDSPDFMLARGLGKLLEDRTKWVETAAVDPVELRRALYEAAAAHHPVLAQAAEGQSRDRGSIVAEVASGFGIDAAQVEAFMYADRRDEQTIESVRELGAEELITRYNLSMVQAILLRATELRIFVQAKDPKRLRELFRYLKFYRLMHRTTRVDATKWQITVDGPLSLFSQNQRYGLQMAMFLPALVLLDKWSMEADITWPRRPRTMALELDQSSGLKTFLRSKGTWQTDEEKLLRERFAKRRKGWILTDRVDVIDLGGHDVLIPDLVLEHKDGRRVAIELIGYWRRSYLERRFELLARYAPKNLVLCVSRKLATGEKLADAGVHVLNYATVIPASKLIEELNNASS